MNSNFKFFVLCSLFLLSVFSCKKDIEFSDKVEEKISVDLESRNDPFFNDNYIISTLGISPNTEMPAPYKDEFKDYILNLNAGDRDQIINLSLNNLGHPCWECGDFEYYAPVGYFLTYIPILSAATEKTEGLLIGKYHDDAYVYLFVVDKSLLDVDETGYWAGIFHFFDLKAQNQSPNKDDYFDQRLVVCIINTPEHDAPPSEVEGCHCNSGYECSGWGSNNCINTTCVPTGGQTGGGNNNEPTPPPIPTNPTPTWWEGMFEWWIGSIWQFGHPVWTSSNAGAGINSEGYFDVSSYDYINGGIDGALIADLINSFKSRYDIYISSLDILNILVECGIDEYLEFKYELFAPQHELPDCVKAIILEADIQHLLIEDGLVLTEEEIQNIYPDVMLYSGAFPTYKKTGMVNYLKETIGFDSDAEAWLGSRDFEDIVLIYEYLRDNEFSPDVLSTIQILLNLTGDTEQDLNGMDHFFWLLDKDGFIQELNIFTFNFDGQANTMDIVEAMLAIYDPNISETVLISFLQEIDAYFDNPDDEDNINQLMVFLENNNIDILAAVNRGVITASPSSNTDWSPPQEDGTVWEPLDATKFWEIAGPVKSSLINQYPTQTDLIDQFFPCRVLGVALENMALASLGVPKNTQSIEGGGGTAIPDGMLKGWVSHDWIFDWIEQPIILEVKGRFSTTNNIFDYSSQSQQYSVYRNHVVDNSYLPESTLSHGIYLIMPNGKELSQSMLNLANQQNIPIYLSWVEVDQNNSNKARVTWPSVKNYDNLNKSSLQFYFLGDAFFKKMMPRAIAKWNNLQFQFSDLNLQEAADKFASSYLENNTEPDNDECPD